MPLPLVGAHAVLEGMPEFNKNADMVNNKVGEMHNKMSGLGGVADKAAGMVGGAFKAIATASVAGAAGVAAVGGGILKLAYDASTLPGIENVFKNMTNAMSVDADALMGKMRAATYGAIKDFDLMKSANKAMVGAGKEFGKMFAESLPTLMQVSREAAKAQGLSVEYMYESIVTGVKRMSPMILDNLGFQISLGDAQEKYAAKVGKTSAELSKEEKQMALLNEVMRLGTQLVEESGGHVDSVQKDVLAWGTAIANVKDRIGIELLPILQKFMNILGKPSQGMQDAIVRVASNFVDKLLPAIDKVVTAISALTGGPLALLIKGFASLGSVGLGNLGSSLAGIFTGATSNFGNLGALITAALTPALGTNLAAAIGRKVMEIGQAVQKGLEPVRKWLSGFHKDLIYWGGVLRADFDLIVKGIQIALGGGGFSPLFLMIQKLIRDTFGDDVARILSKVVGVFAAAAGFIAQHSDTIISALKGVAAFMAGQAMLNAATGMAATVTKVLGGLGGSVTGLLSPIGLLMAGSALLAVAWDKDWFNIRERAAEAAKILTGVIEGISATLAGGDFPWEDVLPPALATVAYDVVDAIKSMITSVQNLVTASQPLLSSLGAIVDFALKGDWTAAWESLGGVVSQYLGTDVAVALDNFRVTVTDTFTNISTLITNAFSLILAVSQAVWPYVQAIITTVWNAVYVVLYNVITVVLPALVAGFNTILTWVNANWPAIQAIIVSVVTVIATVLYAVISTVVPYVIGVFQGLVEWVVNNWPTISATIMTVLDFVWGVIQIVLTNISDFWTAHGAAILRIVSDVWSWIQAVIDTAIKLIQNILMTTMAIIRGDWETVWKLIWENLKLIWDLMKKTIETALGLIRDLIEVAWGLIIAGVKAAWQIIWLVISNTWDSIKDTIEKALKAAIKFLTDTMDNFKKTWTNIWDGIGQIVKNAWNSIIGFVCGGLNKAIDLINDLIDAANKIPGINIPKIGNIDCKGIMLAQGGILNKPTFVAGEAGAEVVAPVQDLLSMIKSGLTAAITDVMYRSNNNVPYSGPQPSVTNYGGDTYDQKVYNLTTQSIVRPGTLAMEFRAMELAHA